MIAPETAHSLSMSLLGVGGALAPDCPTRRAETRRARSQRGRVSAIASLLFVVLSFIPIVSFLPGMAAGQEPLGDAEAKDRARWVVLPAHAHRPPPADPSLSRLTEEVTEAVRALSGGSTVRVGSPEDRDEHCPTVDGMCPLDIAASLGSDRIVALALSDDLGSLLVRVFGAGLEAEGKIPCRWSEGRVACETDRLRDVLAGIGEEVVTLGIDPLVVEAALEQLRPKFLRCLERAPVPFGARPADAWVRFRARPDGRVQDVRIDPKDLLDLEAYGCMARLVESLRVPPFRGSVQPFRFPLGSGEKGKSRSRAGARARKKSLKKP